jgi:pimeloyl-ACP methyl ester carboxylesterase
MNKAKEQNEMTETSRFREEPATRSHRVVVRGSKDSASGELYCAEDDFSDGWREPDTVLTIHGIAERAEIWRPWSPHLARQHRVLRVDLRGFGRSSAMPAGFGIADWADDLEQLVAALGRTRVHLVATKLGAQVAFELAQRRLPWIRSMTLAGMLPSPNKSLGPWLDDWLAMVEGPGNGVERWADATMPGRMGSSLSPEALQWWTELMGTAPAASVAACFRLLPAIDGPSNPHRVQCPTLFIAAGAPPADNGSQYQQRPAASDLQRLRESVPVSAWTEVAADSYHIAATHPDDCARATAAFIDGLAV